MPASAAFIRRFQRIELPFLQLSETFFDSPVRDGPRLLDVLGPDV